MQLLAIPPSHLQNRYMGLWVGEKSLKGTVLFVS